MNWFGKRQSHEPARFTRLFDEAEQKSSDGLDALFASNAASGRLQSGATIKSAVDIFDAMTAFAIRESLKGIGAITEHPGRKRRRLVSTLRAALALHRDRVDEGLQTRLNVIGLASDLKHARERITQARSRQDAMIADYAQGWTAPAGKPWKDRHPIVFGALLALLGAAATLIAQAVAGNFTQQHSWMDHK